MKYTKMKQIPHAYHSDMRTMLRRMKPESFHSAVTDPPYHLTSVVKRFGAANSAPAQYGTDGAYSRASRGFMGRTWDGGDVAFRPEAWAEVLRVMRPGAHLLAFGGTRTYHRMVCAIEDAGFEIRDQIGWMYGAGFPKSHNLHGEWEGWGTSLKPAWEPICLARKPLAHGMTVAENVLTYGCGAINIDASRVALPDNDKLQGGVIHDGSAIDTRDGTAWGFRAMDRAPRVGRWPANIITSKPENEYHLKQGINAEQKVDLYRWMSENT